MLVEAHRRSGLTQSELASWLGRYQSVVAAIEGGGRRVDFVEFLDNADALDIDAATLIAIVRSVRTSS
ncbi:MULTISPECIES: transcriptional regulator [unclassified Methylobacterium]|uniref:transcriptional regulator n=1 Tax=unclassified Methylobacterium TaxID=2615210 RepID=UPI000399DCB3|nr:MULTISPECIES: transcriptional regulator [unclassified Methylobacterium]